MKFNFMWYLYFNMFKKWDWKWKIPLISNIQVWGKKHKWKWAKKRNVVLFLWSNGETKNDLQYSHKGNTYENNKCFICRIMKIASLFGLENVRSEKLLKSAFIWGTICLNIHILHNLSFIVEIKGRYSRYVEICDVLTDLQNVWRYDLSCLQNKQYVISQQNIIMKQ